MKTYIQEGENIKVVAPYVLASGDGCQVGVMFGVAIDAAANGADVVLVTYGVLDIKAATADVAAQGAAAYWDNAAKQVTTTVGANIKIGVFAVAKAAGPVVGRVRLNGSY